MDQLKLISSFIGFTRWTFPAMFCLISCIHEDISDCYNVEINYIYRHESLGNANVIPDYIQSIEEYIYNSEGILVDVSHRTQTFSAPLRLSEGNYTVIAWGNKLNSEELADAEIGQASKYTMSLHKGIPILKPNSTKADEAILSNMQSLYYGRRVFCVKPGSRGRVNVNMAHAHALLNLKVIWKSKAPDNIDKAYFLFKEIPSFYSFVPSRLYKQGYWVTHKPSEEEYPVSANDNVRYLPEENSRENLVTHRVAVKATGQTLDAQFITYRYLNDSPLLLSLYVESKQVMKEISLLEFFQEMKVDLEATLSQVYDIQLIINGDQVTISYIDVNDWDEGGYL
jgi:hypothetical protein